MILLYLLFKPSNPKIKLSNQLKTREMVRCSNMIDEGIKIRSKSAFQNKKIVLLQNFSFITDQQRWMTTPQQPQYITSKYQTSPSHHHALWNCYLFIISFVLLMEKKIRVIWICNPEKLCVNWWRRVVCWMYLGPKYKFVISDFSDLNMTLWIR